MQVTVFYSDYNNGVSGLIRGGVKVPCNTFAMKPTIFVEVDEFMGYYVDVVRELDKKQRYGSTCILQKIVTPCSV